jgi:TonB-linked SusC/RagA family outer membrane protein
MVSFNVPFTTTLFSAPVTFRILSLLTILSIFCIGDVLGKNQINQQFQDTVVTGKVVNEKAEPLEGATINVKGSTLSVTTKADGSFTVKSPLTSTLAVSMVGYTSQEIRLNGRAAVNITLQLASTTLTDVVVTALGIERQKKTLTYSTQAVNTRSLSQARELNVVNALQGKVAGLNISSGSSGLGSATRVILRGNRSINGNSQALFVVDGIQVSDISNINPDNITKINVLKGANAAALYGSAGQNGVIVIETKKGKEGVQVTLNTNYMLTQVIHSIPYQYEYGQGINGIYNSSAESAWGPVLNDSMVTSWSLIPSKIGTKYPFSAYWDTKEEIFQTGQSSASNLSISMGNDRLQSVINYTYTDATGIVPNNGLKRHNITVRLSGKISKRLSFDSKIEYNKQTLGNVLSEGESSFNPLRQIYTTPPNIRMEDMKEYEFTNPSTGLPQQNYWSTAITGANPYWTVYRNLRKNTNDVFSSMASLSYMFTDNLRLMLRGSLASTKNVADERSYYGTFRDPSGRYALSKNEISLYHGEFLLNYEKSLHKDFDLSANVGGEIRHNNTSSMGANTGSGLITPNIFALENSQLPVVSTGFTEFETQSLYYSVRVGWKQAIYLEHTGRNDWSSALPAANRSYYYPSIGTSIVLSELFQLPVGFSHLKLRGSWSQVGNSTSPHQLERFASILPGGATGYILLSSVEPNKNLKPEMTVSREAGVEAGFLNGRAGIDVTVYKTNTNDQLFTQVLPVGSGSTSYFTNGGDVENKGFEIIVSGEPIKTDRFNWDININFAMNKSLVRDLNSNTTRLVIGSDTYMRDFVLEAGKEFGLMYGRGFQRNAKGEVIVNATTGLPLITPGRTVLLGNINPDWTGGLVNSVGFKNWSFNFVISHKQGGTIASYTDAILYGDGHVQETVQGRSGGLIFGQNIFGEYPSVKPDGSANNVNVTAQQLWSFLANRNTPIAEVLTRSATNTRLREATLAYQVPGRVFKNRISSAEIAITGRNLFFFYRASTNIDPDYIAGTGTASEGFQSFAPPPTRSIGINLKVNF